MIKLRIHEGETICYDSVATRNGGCLAVAEERLGLSHVVTRAQTHEAKAEDKW